MPRLADIAPPSCDTVGIYWHKPSKRFICYVGYHKILITDDDGFTTEKRVQSTQYLGTKGEEEACVEKFNELRRHWQKVVEQQRQVYDQEQERRRLLRQPPLSRFKPCWPSETAADSAQPAIVRATLPRIARSTSEGRDVLDLTLLEAKDQYLATYRRRVGLLNGKGIKENTYVKHEQAIRHLRANTKKPNSAANDIKNFEDRLRRKAKRRKLRNEAPVISTIDWSAMGSQTSRLRKNWTDETNVVITGDCLKILSELPYGLIDRFAFSPPYYLADGTSDEFFIEYGHDYRPFKSWDHYCNWTMRYLTDMWLLLPAGGYIVINITNTREPFNVPIKNNGKEKTSKNPIGGRFYFHTDLIRSIMRDIDVYCNLVTQTTLLEDEGSSPFLSVNTAV